MSSVLPYSNPGQLARPIARTFTPVRSLIHALRVLGWKDGLNYAIRRAVEYNPVLLKSYSYRLRSPLLRHAVECRRGTSDIQVFRQVFIEEQYGCVMGVHDAKLIVDCGANVGYSAAYFLSRFPNAHVIAVEPDPDNFRVMLRNVSRFQDRVTAIRSAVWSHACDLVLSTATSVRGLEWSRQVRPATANERERFPLSTSVRCLRHLATAESRF